MDFLPRVRQDLRVLPVENARDGKRRWLLQDLVSHRYFRLADRSVELLPFVQGKAPSQAAEEASGKLGRPVAAEELTRLADFLRRHDLVLGDSEQQRRYIQALDARPTGIAKLLKTYLFIRIPLTNPDRWLTRNVHRVRWLGRKHVLVLLLTLCVLGLWLTLRQWDNFIAGFGQLQQLAGMASLACALILVKTLHELGHAFVAKAKGVKVPTIGLAFIVGWPILYTETSDAWRLTRARDRVHIDIAGIAVELAVAVLALVLWHVLPDGFIKSVCFWLAGTTWIMSLLVNFNPLMRFDGYHIMADALRQPNLETRSQALARWQLREWLFGFNEMPPESPDRRLIVFAFSVWVYRLFLFLAIAVAVYYFFFKLLGIFLFAVEIWYFILRPITNEIRQWFREGRRLKLNWPAARTLVLCLGSLWLFLWPWQTHQTFPALLTYGITQFEAPIAGTLESSISLGANVDAGAPVVQIRSNHLEHQLEMAQTRLQHLTLQLRSASYDDDLLAQSPVLTAERATQVRRVKNLQQQIASGRLVASQPGFVGNISADLATGQQVAEGEPLLTLAHPQVVRLVAWIPEELALQVQQASGQGRFYSQAPGHAKPLPVQLEEVAPSAISSLEFPEMADRHGGSIPVRSSSKTNLEPLESWYRAEFSVPQSNLNQATDLAAQRRIGSLRLSVPPQSYAQELWRNLAGLWQRETAF
ncbi:HlyD family efflux transporter periplasmic adaptor subunit [Marinobacter sp.]|uniref:HlyD family efflux transporter periplasmic adaptor subunit n=2 Tax=Marinobacter sp. TaxID=50741 RepID=UPI0035C6F989